MSFQWFCRVFSRFVLWQLKRKGISNKIWAMLSGSRSTRNFNLRLLFVPQHSHNGSRTQFFAHMPKITLAWFCFSQPFYFEKIQSILWVSKMPKTPAKATKAKRPLFIKCTHKIWTLFFSRWEFFKIKKGCRKIGKKSKHYWSLLKPKGTKTKCAKKYNHH